jgi:hypothetical protein
MTFRGGDKIMIFCDDVSFLAGIYIIYLMLCVKQGKPNKGKPTKENQQGQQASKEQ